VRHPFPRKLAVPGRPRFHKDDANQDLTISFVRAISDIRGKTNPALFEDRTIVTIAILN